MAEVLAVGSASIALFQIIDRLTGCCRHYLSSYSDAPNDLRAILLETSSLKTLLENRVYLDKCDNEGDTPDRDGSSLQSLVQECHTLIHDLDALLPTIPSSSQNGTDDQSRPTKRRKMKDAGARLAWPLKETKAKKLLERLRAVKHAINLDLTTESHRDILTIKSSVNEVQEALSASERRLIYMWLQHTDPTSLYDQAKADYEDGTGNWILRMPEWIQWLNGDFQHLWVHGIPGAGKTVLLAHLISEVEEYCKRDSHNGYYCGYYFCYHGNNQDEAGPFLRWLIVELCRRSKVVPNNIQSLFHEGRDPAVSELFNSLELMLTTFEKVYLVIDALDESMPRNQLLQVMRALAVDNRFQNLQTLSSSREYNDIEVVMRDISVPVSMDNDELQSDIRIAVAARVNKQRKLKTLQAGIRDEIVEAVSTEAKGMFRWAICQIDVIRRQRIDSTSIRKQLSNLPKTVEQTYDRVLSIMTTEDQYVLCCLVKWTIFYIQAFHDPPNSQLLFLVAARAMEYIENFAAGYVYDLEDLKDLCGCFIHFVSPRSDVSRKNKMTFGSLAHYTVREYASTLSFTSRTETRTRDGPGLHNPLHMIIHEAYALRSNLNTSPRTILRESMKDLDECPTLGIWCMAMVYDLLYMSIRVADEVSREEDLFIRSIALLKPGLFPNEFIRDWRDMNAALCPLKWVFQHVREDIEATYFWNGVMIFQQHDQLLSKFLKQLNVPDIMRTHFKFDIPPILNNGLCYDTWRDCEGIPIEIISRIGFTNTRDLRRILKALAAHCDMSEWIVYAAHVHIKDCPAESCDANKGCVLKNIIEFGADPMASYHGVMPLQVAVDQGDYRAVEALLEADADPNAIIDNNFYCDAETPELPRTHVLKGRSPLWLCRAKRHQLAKSHERQGYMDGIESILVKRGAKAFCAPGHESQDYRSPPLPLSTHPLPAPLVRSSILRVRDFEYY